MKYRIAYGPVHFGAMYKFADGQGGCYSPEPPGLPPPAHRNRRTTMRTDSTSAEKSAGVRQVLRRPRLSALQSGDQRLESLAGAQSPATPHLGYTQSLTDSINTNPINGGDALGPDLISTDDTLYGIVTDNNAIMVAVKYVWNPFKFFAGYEYIWQNNPANPLGVGAEDQGGYIMSGVEDNNLDSEKLVNIWWTGAKYTYRSKTDFTFAWYQQRQNDFRTPPECSASAGFRSSCAGTLNEGSLYADHHFTKRFDAFAGIAYSWVSGGLAIAIPHGPGVPYNFDNNFAPTIGGRFTF